MATEGGASFWAQACVSMLCPAGRATPRRVRSARTPGQRFRPKRRRLASNRQIHRSFRFIAPNACPPSAEEREQENDPPCCTSPGRPVVSGSRLPVKTMVWRAAAGKFLFAFVRFCSHAGDSGKFTSRPNANKSEQIRQKTEPGRGLPRGACHESSSGGPHDFPLILQGSRPGPGLQPAGARSCGGHLAGGPGSRPNTKLKPL